MGQSALGLACTIQAAANWRSCRNVACRSGSADMIWPSVTSCSRQPRARRSIRRRVSRRHPLQSRRGNRAATPGCSRQFFYAPYWSPLHALVPNGSGALLHTASPNRYVPVTSRMVQRSRWTHAAERLPTPKQKAERLKRSAFPFQPPELVFRRRPLAAPARTLPPDRAAHSHGPRQSRCNWRPRMPGSVFS